jgi:hypothetical protein
MSLLTQFYGGSGGSSGSSTVAQPVNTGSTWGSALSLVAYSSGSYWLTSNAGGGAELIYTTDPANIQTSAGEAPSGNGGVFYVPGPNGNIRGIYSVPQAPFYIPVNLVSGQVGGIISTVAGGAGNPAGRQGGNPGGGFYIQSNDTWNLFWNDTDFPSTGTDYRILRSRPTGLSPDIATSQAYVTTFGTNQVVAFASGREGFGKGYVYTTSGFWSTVDGVTYTNRNVSPLPAGYNITTGGFVAGGSADTTIIMSVASTTAGNFLYRSTDDGVTWGPLGVANGLPATSSIYSTGVSNNLGRSLGYSASNGKFWIWLEGDLSAGLWTSSDLGATWTQTTLDATVKTNLYLGSVPIPRGNSDRIWYSYPVVDVSATTTRNVWASIPVT